MGAQGTKPIAANRRAYRDYELLERVEAGLVLVGTEIKSIRAGRVDMRDAFARVTDDEMWLHQLHVAPWASGGPWNHDPLRPRKLLLHRDEIHRLGLKAAQQGLTLVPLRLYFRNRRAKVELALARGRRQYDKRQAVIRKEALANVTN